jgi:hypothetical protein
MSFSFYAHENFNLKWTSLLKHVHTLCSGEHEYHRIVLRVAENGVFD